MGIFSRLNWNLEMLVFEARGDLEYPEKTSWSKDKNQKQIIIIYQDNSELTETISVKRYTHESCSLASGGATGVWSIV